MKQAFYLIAHLLFFCPYPCAFSQIWTDRAPIPTPRWYPGCAAVDGNVYVIGGQDSTAPYSSLTTVEVYDPALDIWNTKASMAIDRWGMAVAVVQGKIYAIGGQRGSFSGGYTSTDVVEEYDPQINTWFQKTSMPTARGWGGCAVYNDTIFVFGGYRKPGNQVLDIIEKYHAPTDSWTSESPMPSARRTFMSALAEDKVYLIGGWNSALVEEYNLMTKTWTTKTPMPTARGGSGVAVINGDVYIIGGRGGYSDEFEYYDPLTDTWTTLLPLPTPREGLVAAAVDTRLYAITGSAPISQGGLPYYGTNEEASDFTAVQEHGAQQKPNQCFTCPNPFNTSTQIYYKVNARSDVEIAVYSVSGRRLLVLLHEVQEPGSHLINWRGLDSSGNQLPNGVYLLRFKEASQIHIEKCLLLR